MSETKQAFISTLHSDQPISIESMTDENFFFVCDFEIPLETPLLLKDPSLIKDGARHLIRFEVVEVQEVDGKYRYYAVFGKRKFNFEEWEKKHRRA